MIFFQKKLKICTKEIHSILTQYTELKGNNEIINKTTDEISKSEAASPNINAETTPIGFKTSQSSFVSHKSENKEVKNETHIDTENNDNTINNETNENINNINNINEIPQNKNEVENNNEVLEKNREENAEKICEIEKDKETNENNIIEEIEEKNNERNLEDLKKNLAKISEIKAEIMDLEIEMNDLAEVSFIFLITHIIYINKAEKYDEAEEKNAKITELQKQEEDQFTIIKNVWDVKNMEEALLILKNA